VGVEEEQNNLPHLLEVVAGEEANPYPN